MKLNKWAQWCCIVVSLTFSVFSTAEELKGKKVLHIDSYDESYEWSRSLKHTLDHAFADTGIELTHFYMDAKRHASEAETTQAGLQAKALIEKLHPDLVIASDDEVARHVIVPYYKNVALPFVFCGINWDATQYGFPLQNVTSILEVDLATNIVKQLREYARGDRVGYIAFNGFSEVNTAAYYRQKLNINLQKTYFVKTYAEWQDAFKRAQEEVDILLISNTNGIVGWELEPAITFIEQNTRIPTGATHRWLAPLALLSIVKFPEEQASWAAQTALKILNGAKPSDFPITQNKEGKLILNLRIALNMGITFKPALLRIVGTVGILH